MDVLLVRASTAGAAAPASGGRAVPDQFRGFLNPLAIFGHSLKKRQLFFMDIQLDPVRGGNIHWRAPALFRTYLRRQGELWELSTHRYHPSKLFQPIRPSRRHP